MRWVLSAIFRYAVFFLVWLGLSAADPSNLSYGAIAVAATTALSMALLPPKRPAFQLWPARIWGTVRLVAWFLVQSVSGGADVARRALSPQVDIAPAVVDVQVRLPHGAAQQLCFLLMNLLPGSMVQHVRTVDGQLVAEIHTLALELEPGEQWQTLQDRVQQAFQVADNNAAT